VGDNAPGRQDVDTERGTLMIREGKGKKDRVIPTAIAPRRGWKNISANRALTWWSNRMTARCSCPMPASRSHSII
jgi:hypothetical protein